ncbi:hypothetical protein Tco_0277403 [Tanacetum coccineum]
MESFVTKLDVNIMALNYLVNGMLLNLIKYLYVPFGIPFDPKRYYKDGVYKRMLQRPRYVSFTYRSEALVFDFGGLTDLMAEGLSSRMPMKHKDAQGIGFGEAVVDLDTAGALQFMRSLMICAPEATKDAPVVDEGAPDDLAPIAMWDYVVMSTDRSRVTNHSGFATWMVSCMTQLMDASGRTYQAFDSTLVGSSWYQTEDAPTQAQDR